MDWQIVSIACFFVLAISAVSTRIVVQRNKKKALRNRVEALVPLSMPVAVNTEQAPVTKLLPSQTDSQVRKMIDLAGWNAQPQELLMGSVCLFSGTAVALFALFDANPLLCVVAGLCLASIPWIFLAVKANSVRQKLTFQLPNALDLMVSVLKSGYSLPQAIKAVANEMPQPCAREFGEILHRINLGQGLSEALTYTVAKYGSFELDLLRRAFAIHAEVGGSLSELLEKTNKTLKERIKLKRHIEVLTGPSKLSATIVGLLPFVMAGGFYLVSPSYLSPILTTRVGNVLIVIALVLQMIGVFVMRRLASFKV